MLFADLALAKCLERTEGHACRQFAAARRKAVHGSNSAWDEIAGTVVVFDGIDSPVTQTFCLGLFQDLCADTLDEIEKFFFKRGASVMQEVCPLVGPAALTLLCDRGYRPIEVSNVMYRVIEESSVAINPKIEVRITGPNEARLWADVSARGWADEHPELVESIRSFGEVAAAREHGFCFLAEFEGHPAAAGSLTTHEHVALFGGASTIPGFRNRGLQAALLGARMNYARTQGCDLAMMVAEAGSKSQRNAERKGLRVAYTRTKWCLPFLSAG